jgi:hypothetical protein
MKPKILRERGQALILIAFGALALFAITGLAIDGSAKMSDRRHAQNAADTAAIAGALKMAQEDAKGNGVGNKCPPENGSPTPACADVVTVAKNRAYQNGFTDDKQRSIVAVHIPPLTGVYKNCNDIHFDCNDYVQVVITSNRDTWFMRVLGITQTTNTVYAVASKLSDEDFFDIGGSAVVALKPDGCALMSQGGTSLHVVGGGLYSNSDDPSCAFKKDSCAGVTNIDLNTNPTPDPGSITTIGGMSINTGCPPDASLAPAPSGVKQIPFPPPWEEIDPPAECSQPLINNVNGTTVTLEPGHYKSMPPKPNIKNVTLKPGVYCIDDEIRIGSQDSFIVQGTFKVSPGVFLYIKPGGSFTINAGSVAVLWGINQANVDANATLAPYKGYLIYSAPDYSGTPTTCTINGGNSSWFQGTIYAPYCNVTLNGGSGSEGLQTKVIAYTVKFSGNSTIYLTYNEDSSPDMTVPLQVGLSK